MRRKASPPSVLSVSSMTRFPRSCAVSAAKTRVTAEPATESKKIRRFIGSVSIPPAVEYRDGRPPVYVASFAIHPSPFLPPDESRTGIIQLPGYSFEDNKPQPHKCLNYLLRTAGTAEVPLALFSSSVMSHTGCNSMPVD